MLANRLTENPHWNVLLIEAGKVETGIQAIPVLAAYMQSTAYNWGYLSEPSPGSCLGETLISKAIKSFLNMLIRFQEWRVNGKYLFRLAKLVLI